LLGETEEEKKRKKKNKKNNLEPRRNWRIHNIRTMWNLFLISLSFFSQSSSF